MSFLHQPLKKMHFTQPFGVDWTETNLYARLGMAGHNGWDLRAAVGTPVLACMGGKAYIQIEAPLGETIPGYKSGYGINVRIRDTVLGLEAVYAHLSHTLIKHGEIVKVGQEIALSGNTGFSNGPHLHWGIRPITYDPGGAGPNYPTYGNGFKGYIDPSPYFSEEKLLEWMGKVLPVDKKYGGVKPAVSEFRFYRDMYDYWKTFGRLMPRREYLAYRFGMWGRRTVLDPAMHNIWTQMTKPEAQKRGIIK